VGVIQRPQGTLLKATATGSSGTGETWASSGGGGGGGGGGRDGMRNDVQDLAGLAEIVAGILDDGLHEHGNDEERRGGGHQCRRLLQLALGCRERAQQDMHTSTADVERCLQFAERGNGGRRCNEAWSNVRKPSSQRSRVGGGGGAASSSFFVAC